MSVVLRPDRRAPARPRSSPETVKQLARRLTPRDRHIMRLVWQHKVFTTDQLTALGWNSYNTAKQRLATLHRLRALDRLRPWKPHGGAPWHYVLDQPGAEILAAENGQSLREFGYRRDRALAAGYSATLDHTLGTNQFFVDLYTHTRHHDDTHLDWWTETTCTHHYGDIVRPDAAGRWRVADRRVDFFLEYDTGTERLRRLTAKLDAYQELADLTTTSAIVLFYLPSQRREAHLRHALGPRPAVLVATAVHGAHPARHVWVRVDDPHLIPRRLVDLSPRTTYHQPALLEGADDG
ncbi:replication-relaxation family protein [Salinactinospora qingdaonensis]|uniref:Replication-relaxation n=1 Tax=Salinactinospora qingdaonensis TaxID=702744 RepID=A0ABP7FP03_9ACTN